MDSENENKNVKVSKRQKESQGVVVEKSDSKPAGHKVATRSQVDKIVSDTKQAQAKNLKFDHVKAFNGDVEPISEPQDMLEDMVVKP